MTETVHVPLGARAYDIVIGAGVLADETRFWSQHRGRRAAIVTDTNVGALHAATLEDTLERAGLDSVRITVGSGESSKSWDGLRLVCDGILDAKIERGDFVVALGGGVVGDLAGFASGIVRRGTRFVQVPTSLLAQVDSSVGGKTGINTRHGKNLIGAFHQPAHVIVDVDLLATLPERELRAGYAEIVKYGLIGDLAFFDWLEAKRTDLFTRGPALAEAIAVSCRAKAAIVVRDETETGDRALLNLGHTFAHALERMTGYESARLVHGEAVSIGLALAFRFSTALGLCPGQDSVRVARHLQACGLPTTIAQVPGGCGDLDTLIAAMAQDKKVERGALTFILAHGIGKSFVAKGIAADDVRAFLASEMTTAPAVLRT